MRLINAEAADLDDLADLYEAGAPIVRACMVTTVDGAVTGPGGVSGEINNGVDKRVYDMLRDQADAVVVGAGTARDEGYEPAHRPLVVVSRAGAVPPLLQQAPDGGVLLATVETAPGLAQSQSLLGDDQVLVTGHDEMAPARLVAELRRRGLSRLVCEGGPGLLHAMIAAGVIDELDLTVVPRLSAGDGPRLLAGAWLDVSLRPLQIIECEGTLLQRWQVLNRV